MRVDDALLAMALRGGARSALEVGSAVYERSGGAVSLYHTSIMNGLRRLVRERHVEEKLGKPYRGRRRYLYALTRKGEEALGEVLARLVRDGGRTHGERARRGAPSTLMRWCEEGYEGVKERRGESEKGKEGTGGLPRERSRGV